MEMSMGTVVTIVLIIAFMIVGIYFLNQIREGGARAIDGINQGVTNEINKLFSEDNTKTLIVYPATRKITIKKGDDSLGFGFSIRNINQQEGRFLYDVSTTETSCGMRLSDADNLISLGQRGSNIQLPPGTPMEDPIFVRFNIPTDTPPCQIRYSITMREGTALYGTPNFVDLEIESA